MGEYAVIKLLKDSASVGALVADRVYLNAMPYDTENYDDKVLVYIEERDGSQSKDNDGFSVLRFAISSLSQSYQTALSIADAIKNEINNYSGVVSIDGGVNVNIEHCYQMEQNITYSEELNMHLVNSAYKIFSNNT